MTGKPTKKQCGLDQLNHYVSKEHPKEEGFQYGNYVVTEEQRGNQKK